MSDPNYPVGTITLIPFSFDVTQGGAILPANVLAAVIPLSGSYEDATFALADTVGSDIGYLLGSASKVKPVGGYRLLAKIQANPEMPIMEAGVFYVVEPSPAINRGMAPVDPTTTVGLTRLLVGDSDPTNVGGGQGSFIWYSDTEMLALLGAHSNDPARTAVFILRMVSLTPAMILKKWTSADLNVDGPAITTALTGAIDAIEKGIKTAADAANQDFFQVVSLGATVAQPHWLDRNQLFDVTLPLLWSFYRPVSALAVYSGY